MADTWSRATTLDISRCCIYEQYTACAFAFNRLRSQFGTKTGPEKILSFARSDEINVKYSERGRLTHYGGKLSFQDLHTVSALTDEPSLRSAPYSVASVSMP